MPLAENFRENLKSFLDEHGISQMKLAELSGISYVTISRILSGKNEPSLATCEALAKAAGMRADTSFLSPERIGT